VVRDGVADRVHLVDPDPGSRQRARKLIADEPHVPDVEVEEWDDVAELTADVEVAVVATGSAIRSQVVTGLLDAVRVEHLLLEKFLFPRRSEYQQVAELLRTVGTTGWVNTPRRLWPGYQQLRETLDPDAPRSLRIQANPDHGLGSNAVHFVDLFRFLLGSDALESPGLELQGYNLRAIDNHRRAGYIEFDGTIHGTMARGDHLDITAMVGSQAPLIVSLTCGDEHFVVHEVAGELLRTSTHTDGWQRDPFTLRLQSELTGQVVRDLTATGRCGLPSLEDATVSHLALLGPFLEAIGATEEDAPCLVT
jgi:predicted dehydrogenase